MGLREFLSALFRGEKIAWSRINWTKVAIWLIVLVPGIPFLLLSLTITGHIYLPRSYDALDLPEIEPDTSWVILSAHGVKDRAATWSEPLARIQRQRYPEAQVVALDWSEYAASTFRCSVDGLRIGRRVGRSLAAGTNLEDVHLIGHSCGSFVVLGACREIKEYAPGVRVQATFLDPVSVYGGFFWDYGLDHFAGCADFNEAYIDTGDTVPGSNVPLPGAYTFDITPARIDSDFSGLPHVWPVHYYMALTDSEQARSYRLDKNLAARYPQGTSEVVDHLPRQAESGDTTGIDGQSPKKVIPLKRSITEEY